MRLRNFAKSSRRARLVLIPMIALCVTSCTSSKIASRESKEEVHARHSEVIRVDSLVYRDSVIYSLRNDTVLIERVKYRDRFRLDTVRLCDTVKVSEIKKVEKVKRVTDWQSVIWFCGFVALISLIIRIIRKCRVLR